jgi:hypothetical protein
MDTKNKFIAQTAKDYDVTPEIVKYFYDNFGVELMYEKLEEYINA